MKVFFASVLLTAFLTANGLVCWHCFNKRDNEACLRSGVARRCLNNELYCFSEVRRGSDGYRIFKRCKQPHACDNNFVQNPRAAWLPSQCNPKKPSSVCRCCCDQDLCNRPTELCVGALGEQPECVKIRPPRNGRKECAPLEEDFKNTVVPGTLCRFKCNFGYTLVGDTSSMCELSEDGNTAAFNNPTPRCTPRSCNPLRRHPKNGRVGCTDRNNLGSLCTYVCNEGYRVSGSRTTRCLSTMQWSEPPPTCVALKCNPPHADPENGRVVCSNENNLDSFCRFTCDDTYTLAGRPSSTCRDDGDGDAEGVWSSPAPVCRKIECRPPHRNPRNGEVECTNTNLEGSVCSFTCLPGYSLEGSPRSTCRDDFDGDSLGLWSSPAPLCRRITCRPPHSNPRNGQVTCSDENLEGSLCLFTCEDGYFLDGSPNSVCEDNGNLDDNGEWSEPAPVCRRITCRPPHRNPRNGDVDCSNSNNEGSLCSFTCRAGYFLNGSPTSLCEDDGDNDALGEWSDRAPTCSRVICIPRQTNPTNGEVECTDVNNVGSICSFACDGGFFLSGSQRTVCNDDLDGDEFGVWSDAPPVCQQITCSPRFENPENGRVGCSNPNNILGTVCRFTCDNGFYLDGLPRSRCVDDNDGDNAGIWNNRAPVCIQITCPPPHVAPANGGVSCSNGNNEGSTCRFRCNAGFFLDGPARSTCNDDENGDAEGVWSQPPPTCVAIQCSPSFSDPTNGRVTCDDPLNNLGTTCNFECNDGFFLNGEPTSVCQDDRDGDADGVWSNVAPTCSQVTCPPPHRNPRNGEVDCTDSNNDESVCSFTCNDGFFLDGAPESVCNDDGNGDAFGVWSEPAPSCVPIRCSPAFTDPENGGVGCSNPRNILGTLCTFTCNDGYYLDGQPMSECLDDDDNDADGVWSNVPPVCIRVICLPPHEDPTNGGVSCTDENNEGSRCTFTCDSGYFLNGPRRSVCNDDEDGNADGVWSNQPPVCVRIVCPPPHEDPTNGGVICTDENNEGSRCTFTCNAGYFLDGSERSVCNDDENGDAEGVWSQPPPTCQPIRCLPGFGDPRNGRVMCDNALNTLGTQCSFVCNDGFFLNGEPTSVCQDDENGDADGVWSNVAPTCSQVTCPPPHRNPRNGEVDCTDSNNDESVCSFTCNEGFFLDGAPESVCNDDGNGDAFGVWSEPAPSCVPIRCSPAFTDPENGGVGCSNPRNILGTLCTFTCNDGYYLDGEPTSECIDDDNNDADGVWSSVPPVCVRVICPPPHEDPTNGGVNCTDENNEGSRCTFTCNAGYFLDGSEESVCNDDENGDAEGVWSQPPPTCQPIRCLPGFGDPRNGRVICDNALNTLGTQCSFTCDDGYFLSGSSLSTCVDNLDDDADGIWDQPAPTCSRVTCPPPHTNPDNGNVQCNDSNNEQSLCSFTCDAGFYLVGSDESLCRDDNDGNEFGVWTELPPTCQRIRCIPGHEAPRNGDVMCDDPLNNLGTVCSFTCDDGYFLRGSPRSTCNDDFNGDGLGVWSSRAPTCSRVVCPPPHVNPDNGLVDCTSGNNEGSVCSFTCNDGYFLDGPPQSTCEDDLNGDESGLWSHVAPTCVAIRCSPGFSDPDNGGVRCDDPLNNLGTVCNFLCDDGFFLSGSSSSECIDDLNNDADGVWSQDAPVCIRITCPPPHRNPDNGEVTCTASNFENSNCQFTCNAGYYLRGSENSICNDDENGDAEGVWSADAPTCVPIRCSPAFENPQNGIVQCDDPLNNLGTTCSFNCNDGYFLRGSLTAECQDDLDNDADGVWSDDAPFCQRITCPPPHRNPRNGNVDCTDSNNEDSTCTFTCDAGFFLDGSDTSVCRDDENGDAEGAWDQPAPTCVQITCSPSFENPENGRVRCNNPNNNLGTVCNFRCNGGFFLRGSLSSECIDDNNNDADGVWSQQAPSCIPITCVPPHVDPQNGRVECTNSNNENSNCEFTCNNNYALVGDMESRCLDDNNNDEFGEWTNDPPNCQLIVCLPPFTSIDNGNVECTNNNVINSDCEFTCNPGYEIEGEPASTCAPRDGGGVLGDWTVFPAPTCVRRGCEPAPEAPENGFRVCTDGTFLGSECEYGCDDYHTRVGPLYSVCIESPRGLIWDRPAPVCQPNQCPEQILPHGEVVCDDPTLTAPANCQFRCTDPGYVLFPGDVTENDCLNDTTWSLPRPCCAQNCPPFAVMDFNLVLDSSSSIGQENWNTMKAFVRTIIESYTISLDATRVSVFRFNDEVDTVSQILFRDYPDDKAGLLREFDFIEYDGRGTLTGQALAHSRDVIFQESNGDRTNVRDVMLIITDGRAQDSVVEAAQDLRNRGVTIYVLGVIPPQGQLDGVQLEQIAGNPDNIILATSGFQGLDSVLAETISNEICGDPCADDIRLE